MSNKKAATKTDARVSSVSISGTTLWFQSRPWLPMAVPDVFVRHERSTASVLLVEGVGANLCGHPGGRLHVSAASLGVAPGSAAGE